MQKLLDKVAIVTGAAGEGAGGMGRSIARTLAENGAQLVLVDINQEAGEKAVKEFKADGLKAHFIPCDISNADMVQKTVSQTIEQFGKLDILVNNAYIYDATQVRIHELDIEHWDQQFSINIRGHFLFCKFAIPELIKNPNSVIVNISSVASIAPEDKAAAYGASKSALNTLSGYIATQYGRDGLRCNTVLPGLILSEETEKSIAQSPEMQAFFSVYDKNILLNRHGTSTDVANIVLFLASDDSAFITGQKFVVDGGMSAHATELASMRDLLAYAKQ